MVLHSNYKSEDGTNVYLEDVINGTAFYKIGENLITATVKFFESKYKLLRSWYAYDWRHGHNYKIHE